MLRLIFITSGCLWFTLATAVNLDSLWGAWNDKTQPDTNRLKAMHKIAWNGYLFSQPDSAFYFAQIEYELAEATGNKKYIAYALNTQAVSFGIRGNYKEALNHFSKNLKIHKEIGDKEGMASCYTNMGHIYKIQGNYDKALDYYYGCLDIYEEIGGNDGVASCYSNIGTIYQDQGNYEQALENYQKGLKLYKEIGDKQGMAISYTFIGNIYYDQGNYEEALIYQNKSLKINKEFGNKYNLTHCYNQIGAIYQAKGNYEQALEYFEKGLKIAEEIGDKVGMAGSLGSISAICWEQGNYLKALDLGKKAIALGQEVGAVNNIRAASELLYEVYKKTGQPAKALEMYELTIQMRDSVINEENTRAIVQQEYKYKYEKEQAVEEAKHKEEMSLSVEREKRQQLISYGTGVGLALVLAFAFLVFNRFKKTQRQKQVIQQKNKHITESISYARRIQEASLTSKEYMDRVLDEYFIFYQPRDIVSGDFYWVYEIDEDKVMVAVCDCTGHGVPGAFMSMIGTSLLNEIIIENNVRQVDKVLENLRSHIIKALKQDKEKAEAMDGLDMTLLLIDRKKKSLDFASAVHTLYIARNGTVIENKGDPYPVGFFFGREKPFSIKEIALEKGDMLYMTSDGYTEQFGGKENKMFGYEKFKKLIATCKDQPMDEQREQFYRTFNNWKGGGKQIDDICVMGMRF